VDNGSGRKERAGPPPGGPVRSIPKNLVLPGSCPMDLHFGKNGIVLSSNNMLAYAGENLFIAFGF
jgi:hypothetical protein